MNNVRPLDTHRNEEKLKFIELRAKGYPYSKIAQELNVSKGTLVTWNEELKDRIAELKQERLAELYDSYFMLREARITQLGETLRNVNEALEEKDLSELPADKLLEYKLRLMNELKGEFIELQGTNTGTNLNGEAILLELLTLLDRVRRGEITKEQALKENQILTNILKAYEVVNLEGKVEALEAILGGRK